jgi:hypothetical protein
MRPLGRVRWAAAALAALASLACQEQLTQPGQCPELCPGGTPGAVEEVLQALPNGDSAFTGYALRATTGALLVSSNVPTPGDTNLAVIRFAPRADTVRFRDTVRSYTVDSIRLSLGIVARDTLMRSVQLRLFKLPGSLDTASVTYAGVSGFFTDANLIDSPAVLDTLKSGTVTTVIKGAQLSQLNLQPADGGRLTLGVAVTAPAGGTGVRLGSRLSALNLRFISYVKPVANDPGTTSLGVEPAAEFNTYVARNDTPPDPALLAVGGAPASRSLIRFPWPVKLRDSISLVRATLELTPVTPIAGLPNDAGLLDARALLVDLGSKSPAFPSFTRNVALPAGADSVIKVEVVQLVQLWQGSGGRPPALFLAITPEAASFTQGVFGSTRSGTAPRLRITYLSRFPFERP